MMRLRFDARSCICECNGCEANLSTNSRTGPRQFMDHVNAVNTSKEYALISAPFVWQHAVICGIGWVMLMSPLICSVVSRTPPNLSGSLTSSAFGGRAGKSILYCNRLGDMA